MQQDTKPGTFTDEVEILRVGTFRPNHSLEKLFADNLSREGDISNVEPYETYLTNHLALYNGSYITKYSWRGKSENTSLFFSFF